MIVIIFGADPGVSDTDIAAWLCLVVWPAVVQAYDKVVAAA